jgi:hypothetical protein
MPKYPTSKHCVAAAKIALRAAIFRSVHDDGARAYALARWMCVIDQLRSRLSDEAVSTALREAAATYASFTRRSS